MGKRANLIHKIKIVKAKKICELYSLGEYTIAACCEAAGVKYDTFKEWVQPGLTDEDIAIGNYRCGFIKEAHDLYLKSVTQNNTNYKDLLRNKTRLGILLRLTGTKYTETTTDAKIGRNGSAEIAIVRKTEKFVPPDTTMLIFIAKSLNMFPAVNLKDNSDRDNEASLHLLSDEQLREKRLELEQQLLSNSPC